MGARQGSSTMPAGGSAAWIAIEWIASRHKSTTLRSKLRVSISMSQVLDS